MFEKLNTALDMDDQSFNLAETELYLRDKETPVSPEPRQNISKECVICLMRGKLQGKVSKNKKKKLLSKIT